jgi:hypothetical protein
MAEKYIDRCAKPGFHLHREDPLPLPARRHSIQQCLMASSDWSSEYPSRRVSAPRSTNCSRRRSASVVFLCFNIFFRALDREGCGMVPSGGCVSYCAFQRDIRDETYISTVDADNVWFTSSPSNPVRLCFCQQGRRPRLRTSSFRKRINLPLQMASSSSNPCVRHQS